MITEVKAPYRPVQGVAPSRLVPIDRNTALYRMMQGAVRQTFWIYDFISANHIKLSTSAIAIKFLQIKKDS